LYLVIIAMVTRRKTSVTDPSTSSSSSDQAQIRSLSIVIVSPYKIITTAQSQNNIYGDYDDGGFFSLFNITGRRNAEVR